MGWVELSRLGCPSWVVRPITGWRIMLPYVIFGLRYSDFGGKSYRSLQLVADSASSDRANAKGMENLSVMICDRFLFISVHRKVTNLQRAAAPYTGNI